MSEAKVKTGWTCPTCGTEKGDCESGVGTPPPCEHALDLRMSGWNGYVTFRHYVCVKCWQNVYLVNEQSATKSRFEAACPKN